MRKGEATQNTSTVTLRIEYIKNCILMENMYENMKKNIKDNLETEGFSATAISTGDLFALEAAVDNLAKKADCYNLRRVKNWYTGEEVEDSADEYEDYQEMIRDFSWKTHEHTIRDTNTLHKALYAKER